MAQDLPPPTGFPNAIRYQRYIPKRGPSGALIFLTVAGIMAYGWVGFAGSLKEKKYFY
jgi:NADH dehydrogenase (ubiquinone) 1 alpha subcomplex subunit 13